MGAPLATVALFNAVLFSSRGAAERALAHADGSPLTLLDQAKAGAAAGVAVSFVASPTELIKCRLQSQLSAGQQAEAAAAAAASASSAPRPWVGTSAAAAATPGFLAGGGPGPTLTPALGGLTPRPVHTTAAFVTAPAATAAASLPTYKGPRDVVAHILKTEGPRGLTRGLSMTLAREVPGNFVMLGAYAYLKQRAAAAAGLASVDDLGSASLMMAGGAAGTAFWLAVFPADVIKSRWQVAGPGVYPSLAACAAATVKEGGLKGLYRGFGPCLVRAFPANAACFAAYEFATRAMG